MRIALLLAAVLMADAAHADDRVESSTATEAPGGRHLIYVELLGKAGAYGVGYEYRLMPWLSFGGAASFAVVGGQRRPEIHAQLYNDLANYAAKTRCKWLV